jgi:DNA (cytosine-5)-methyltransferase 1
LNHIELFAGCGGLSLGLEQAGFELVLANELSPMAAESFAYNFYKENLEESANQDTEPTHTFWINSQYKDLKSRLRENPFKFPKLNKNGYSDLPNDGNWTNLKGKLLVGSVVELNILLDENPLLVSQLRSAFSQAGELDLVSGGPPCQGFSMAGKRELESDKNSLPWAFAKFVKITQPKIVLFENVTGILRPFKDSNGKSFHAWYEVAKVFASIGYVPLCLHINARQAGVPQNRPRFIMIAVRYDHLSQLLKNSLQNDFMLFSKALNFFELVQKFKEKLPFGHLDYIDATKSAGITVFSNSFLGGLVNNDEISVKDALDDLKRNNPDNPSHFVNELNDTFTKLIKHVAIQNHEARNNSPLVKRRFRLYQILQQINDRKVTHAVFAVLKGESDELSEMAWLALNPFEYLHENGELYRFTSKVTFEKYLHAHPTKKQTQRALVANAPAPAALSIPDDACHYDARELRVLTVREMARIQSFPDNFIFRSKITTGGQMRKFEVPQYTQVGNAVPPLLGLKLGQAITHLLK